MSFPIRQNDTAPPFECTLEESPGDPINLTGATVRFRMQPVAGGSLKVDTVATVVSATAGTVRHTWLAAHTDTVGLFRAWWFITHADGTLQTVPPLDYLYIRVT